MIWLPFDQCDPELEAFASNNEFLPPEFRGQGHRAVKAAELKDVVKKDENVLVVAHGNGVAISNWDPEKKMPKKSKYEEFQPDDFARKLAAILPQGYTGTITLWSCQAARPWRYVKGVPEQLNQRKVANIESVLNQSYLTLLAARLKGLKPEQLVGPIGFITLDQKFSKAAIYENEDQLQYGNTISVQVGTSMVHAGQALNSSFYTKFYQGYQEDDDDDYNPHGSTSMEVDQPTNTSAPAPQTNTSAPPRRVFTSKEEYLNAIVANTPFGSSSQPRSLKERLEFLEKNKNS